MMNDALKKYCQEGIPADEDVRLALYKDTKGIFTIGIGRNLEKNGISLDEAYYLFNNDVNSIYKQLKKYEWFNNLDDVRQYVVINMGFNLGFAGLLAFKKFINFLSLSDWNQAANEMLDSKWALQLENRSHKLARMIISGKFLND